VLWEAGDPAGCSVGDLNLMVVLAHECNTIRFQCVPVGDAHR
jgi:hypothetical protein